MAISAPDNIQNPACMDCFGSKPVHTIATKPMKDLVPAILWQRPAAIPVAA